MAKKGLQKKTRVANKILTVVFSLVSLLYLYPLVMMVLNSFKKKAFISRAPFALPTDKMFAGLANYELGIARTNFWGSMVWSVVITVLSVFLILLCTSMCAWFISRVVNGWTKLVYLLCIFSMVVPFQMVMFTLSKLANTVQLNTPWTIPIVYLGFGAGLAVFMFTGYMRSCPIAIEESAMIDGCTPLGIFFKIVLPQVIKRILPAMGNEIITLVKDTSLAFVLGMAEMFSVAKALAASNVSMIPYAIAALIYWVFCLFIEFILGRVEKKLAYYHD